MSHSNAKTDEIARLWAMNRNIGSVIEKRGKVIRELESKVEDRDAFIAALVILVDGLKARINELETGAVKEVPVKRDKMPGPTYKDGEKTWREGPAWDLRIGGPEDGTSCTIHTGVFPDGDLAEVFLRFGKKDRGSHGASMADLACTYMSLYLQHLHAMKALDPVGYAIAVDDVFQRMVGAVDDSGGWTRRRTIAADGSEEWGADPDLHRCSSLRDYLGKKLKARWGLKQEAQKAEAA